MSFLDWIFKRKKKTKHRRNHRPTLNVDIQEENIKPIELKDSTAIKNYVIDLCEQMIDISREMDEVRREYDQVTSYLNDIQIVESIGGEQKAQLVEISTQVSKLVNLRNEYINAEKKISDEVFYQMEELEKDMPAIIRRLMDNEKYLDTIKRDLNRLAAEKIEWSVLRQERLEEQEKLRKMSKIFIGVFGVVGILLACLLLVMQWPMLPLYIIAFMVSLAAAYIVFRMQECTKDIKKCDVNQNHVIALENRVKIKYVNTKNAVDYTCQRFHVKNSRELTYNYEQYQEVCKEREKLKNVNEDLEYFNNRLVRILRGLNLYDAKIWLTYANAVIDPKEMVELKHGYFVRRQSLRSHIEYNLNAIVDIRKEVDRYIDNMGDKTGQVRDILIKVEEMNREYMQ